MFPQNNGGFEFGIRGTCAGQGTAERLLSALNYGADAVYLGRKQFGMRASSGQF
ncbi:hypothetical protein [Ruminococcus sp. HUN007]|uniref:hypothetical protein n=1 Tax=Ruminococcus sp. HUN007 TaxID=1514668 RepID=UPI000A443433|nr:hypothetical protein [Ruminococcus sp. HUN007]